jgi:hypothetical protein
MNGRTQGVSGYKEDFRIEDGVLYVGLSGEFPKELLGKAQNLFQPLVEACATHNSKRALIDARELQVDFDTMAMFQAGEDAAGLSRIGLRVALVAREDMIDIFFDHVVSNRGGNMGIFTDIDAARAWLQR